MSLASARLHRHANMQIIAPRSWGESANNLGTRDHPCVNTFQCASLHQASIAANLDMFYVSNVARRMGDSPATIYTPQRLQPIAAICQTQQTQSSIRRITLPFPTPTRAQRSRRRISRQSFESMRCELRQEKMKAYYRNAMKSGIFGLNYTTPIIRM